MNTVDFDGEENDVPLLPSDIKHAIFSHALKYKKTLTDRQERVKGMQARSLHDTWISKRRLGQVQRERFQVPH